MIHSDYNAMVDDKGPDFLFAGVKEKIAASDVCFGNLETVLSKAGTPVSGKLCLRGAPHYLNAVKKAGINVVSLANNHAFDFGVEAWSDVVAQLEDFDIKHAGAGLDQTESRQPALLEIRGMKLGFLAYSSRTTNGSAYATAATPGVAPLDEDIVLADVAHWQNKVDHLFVSVHWGVEYAEYPTPDQVSLGRKIIDAGARGVIGHHPHILQGFEAYRGGYIFYSLGNFCDSNLVWESAEKTYQSALKVADRESVLISLDLSSEGITAVECTPLWLNDESQPEIAQGEKESEIRQKLDHRSEVIARPDFEKFWESMILDKRVGGAFRTWLDNGGLWHKVRNFKFSQFLTLWDLLAMYVQTKFSRKKDKYFLLNPGDDKKPRPQCGKEE